MGDEKFQHSVAASRIQDHTHSSKNHQVVIFTKTLDDEQPRKDSQGHGNDGDRQQRDTDDQQLRPAVLDDGHGENSSFLGVALCWACSPVRIEGEGNERHEGKEEFNTVQERDQAETARRTATWDG